MSWGFGRAGGSTSPQYITVEEIDFISHGNLTISNGSNTINGKTWTAANVANSSQFAITANGLEITIGTASDWYEATLTAPILYTNISTLDASTGAMDEYILQADYDYTGVSSGFNGVIFGYRSDTLQGGSNESYAYVGNGESVGSDAVRLRTSYDDSASFNGGTDGVSYNDNTLHILLGEANLRVAGWVGPAYSAGWPSFDTWDPICSSLWVPSTSGVRGRNESFAFDTKVMLGLTQLGTTNASVIIRRLRLLKRKPPTLPA